MSHTSTFCLVRGELRKVVFQRTNWILPVLAGGLGILAANAAGDSAPRLATFQLALDTYRTFAAAAIGVMMLGVAGQLVAAEYHWGTIRVLTARGVGRLRLIVAKLTAVAIVAVPLSALLAVAGAVDIGVRLAQQPGSVVWTEVWLSFLVVIVSALVCALLGAAAGAVGRSLTFALAVGAAFFPADNILGLILPLIQNATQERVWANVTGYLLGPTLNQLPAALMGRPAAQLVGPAMAIDATHGVFVVVGYIATFALGAMIVSLRDITA